MIPRAATAITALLAAAASSLPGAVLGDGSLPVFASPAKGEYFVGAAVGGQMFSLLLSTDAGVLTVPSADCIDCGFHPSLSYERTETFASFGCGGACTRCNPEETECEAEWHLPDPQNATQDNAFFGALGFEHVKLADGVEAPAVPFVAVDAVSGPWEARTNVDGVIGLGLAPSKACTPSCAAPVLGSLRLDAATLYGVCVAPGGRGVLDLGFQDPARYNGTAGGALRYVDPADADGASDYSVAVKATGMLVGGAGVAVPDGQPPLAGAILDSATPFLHVPHAHFDAVLAALAAAAPPGFDTDDGRHCYTIPRNELARWPTLGVSLPDRHGGDDVLVSIVPQVYLFEETVQANTHVRCLALRDASQTRPAGFARQAVTLGTVFMEGNYLVVLGLPSGGARLGVVPATNCPLAGPPPPRTNGAPPADDGVCEACRLGSGECHEVFRAANEQECHELQQGFLAFEDTSLPGGCRDIYDQWNCDFYSELSSHLEDNGCHDRGLDEGVPKICKSSCAAFRFQLAECSGNDQFNDLAVCAHFPDTDCLNATVDDPFRPADSTECVRCELDYCSRAEPVVWANSEAQCAAFQRDGVAEGVPPNCASTVREMSCRYFSGVGQVLHSHGCNSSVPWDEVELCMADCNSFVDDIRECAGDEFDEQRWGSYCDGHPADKCVTLHGGPPEPVDNCFPCHLNDCPGQTFYFGSAEECTLLKTLQVPADSVVAGHNCSARVHADFCGLFEGYSDFVLHEHCRVEGSVRVCRSTCEELRDVVSECVTGGADAGLPECSTLPTKDCVDSTGALVEPSRGGGGGDNKAKIAGAVFGCVAALAVGLCAYVGYDRYKKRKAAGGGGGGGGGSDSATAYAVVGEGNEPML